MMSAIKPKDSIPTMTAEISMFCTLSTVVWSQEHTSSPEQSQQEGISTANSGSMLPCRWAGQHARPGGWGGVGGGGVSLRRAHGHMSTWHRKAALTMAKMK